MKNTANTSQIRPLWR